MTLAEQQTYVVTWHINNNKTANIKDKNLKVYNNVYDCTYIIQLNAAKIKRR